MFKSVEAKLCPVCGNTISGRSDRKYCSDRCRSAYSNQVRARANFKFVRTVNNALFINRNIMASLVEANNIKTTADILRQMGFNFKYHTHTYQSKTGKIYRYSYDYGYLQIEGDRILIVKQDA